ncbi:ABC transporter permease, partial [Burkholderia multivorans]|nr:ABC transporter permease [Burkholderia multivorans]
MRGRVRVQALTLSAVRCSGTHRAACRRTAGRGSRSGPETPPLNTMTIASSPTSTAALKRELKAAEARKRTMALLLIAPLAIFLLL